jgi:hypothetical protein
MESPIFHLRIDTLMQILFTKPAENPKPEKDKASCSALLYELESNSSALPRTPSPQQTVLFCPWSRAVRHLKWWLTKLLAGHLDIVHMYT